MKGASLLALGVALLAGCAGGPEYTRPPSPYRPAEAAGAGTRAAEVAASPDTVWRQVMDRLATSAFAYDGGDQKSGAIELRYTGDPRGYIECGMVESRVKTEQGEKVFRFPAASARQQYQLQSSGKTYRVDRRMSLEARATLRLDPAPRERTRASVRTNYAVTRDQSVQGAGKPIAVTDTIRFASGARGTFPNAPTACQATGVLEREILTLAQPR